MTKIQIDLDENEDFTTEVYKLSHGLKTKQDALKKMIRRSKDRIATEIQDGLNAMEE